MINISEKDGATIIVIENPTASEESLIKKAKSILSFATGDVWGKFKCNQKSGQKSETKVEKKSEQPAKETSSDTEPLGFDDDYPF